MIARMLLLILVMATITYLLRVLPLVFFRKKIKSRYVRSLLFYIPYAVLASMTFPYIFYATGNLYTSIIGTAVALALAFFKRSLIIVASISCLAVLVASFII